MAIVVEASGTEEVDGSGSTKSVSLGTVSADDVVVLAYRREGSTATFSWPSGFTEIVNQTTAASFDQIVLGVAYKVLDGTEGSTFSAGPSTGSVQFEDCFSGVRLSGVDTTTPLDVTSTSADNSFSTASAPPITTVTDGSMHLAMAAVWGNGGSGTPSGYTNAVALTGDSRMPIAYDEIVTASATGAVSWAGSSEVNVGASVALRPASTGDSATISGTGTISATGQRTARASATISGSGSISATALDTSAEDIKVQRGTTTVPSGGTTAAITSVGSLDNAFVLLTNNRHTGVGSSTGNSEADDVSAGARLTATGTITFDKPLGNNSNTAWEVWEYEGDAAGDNEFIVRSRDQVTISSGGSNTATLTNAPTTDGDTIPFINGVTSTTTGDGSNDMSVTAETSGATLTVNRGGTGGTTVVNVTTVEFTGSNWIVAKGTLSGQTADSGTITLDTDIVDWSKAAIVSWGHAGDNTNQAISDNWPILEPGANTTSVDYSFDPNHDGSDDDFVVYVLYHPDLAVTRFSDTVNGVTGNVDVTSAGLTDLERSSVLGTSESSGSGTAYARGWRNYRLTSLTNVEHSCSRTGNTMNHRIQVIDWSGITSSASSGPVTGDATISGSGSISSTGARTAVGSTSIAGVGSISTSGQRTTSESASISGVGSLSATGARTVVGAATIVGSGAVASSGVRVVEGQATIAGTGSLSAAGDTTSGGTATISGATTITASGVRTTSESAAIDGAGSLSATGVRVVTGSATISGTGSISASAEEAVTGDAAIVGSGTLQATGVRVHRAGATIAGTSSVSSASTRTAVGSAAIAGAGVLTSSGVRTVLGAASLAGTGLLASTGRPTRKGSASISGVSMITARFPQAVTGSAVISGTSTLAALAALNKITPLRAFGTNRARQLSNHTESGDAVDEESTTRPLVSLLSRR